MSRSDRRAHLLLTQFRSLVETAGSPIVCLDARHRITVFNPAAERVFGRTRRDVIGRKYVSILPAHVRSKVTADLNRVLDGETLTEFENVIRRADGEYAVLLWNIKRLPPENGTPSGLVAVGQDITAMQQIQERLLRQTRHLLGLTQIDRAIIALQAPAAIARAVLEHLNRIMPCEGAAVVTFHTEAARAVCLAAWGQLTPPVAQTRPLEPTDLREPSWPDTPYGPLMVPLVVNRERLGRLVIGCLQEVDSISLDTLESIGQVADRLALALDKARLFEAEREARRQVQAASARLVGIQEMERRRIARELHDDIGQGLTALKLDLEMQSRASHNGEPGLSRAVSMVQDLIGRVRNLSVDLRPTLLDDLGLVPALISLIERYGAQTNIQVDFKHPGATVRFDPDVETAVFRIVQEALTNIARHAESSMASVRLERRSRFLDVVVEDCGRGFEPDVLGATASSGLSGMRERATMVGGRVTVEAAPGAGTIVRAMLPARRRRTRIS